MSLCVIVPSRGRPDQIRELNQTFLETKTDPLTQLIVAADEDDPMLPGYQNIDREFSVGLYVGPRLRLNGTLNYVAAKAANKYTHLAFMGDDHRPRTRGWDTEMNRELTRMGMGVAYGNDLLQGANLPTAVFMTSNIVQRLGYMSPPALVHMYMDNFWLVLGQQLGALTYRDDVIIEHMHPVAGKAEWDERYVEVNDAGRMEADLVSFEQYLATQFEADLEKLRG